MSALAWLLLPIVATIIGRTDPYDIAELFRVRAEPASVAQVVDQEREQ